MRWVKKGRLSRISSWLWAVLQTHWPTWRNVKAKKTFLFCFNGFHLATRAGAWPLPERVDFADTAPNARSINSFRPSDQAQAKASSCFSPSGHFPWQLVMMTHVSNVHFYRILSPFYLSSPLNLSNIRVHLSLFLPLCSNVIKGFKCLCLSPYRIVVLGV